MRRLGTFGLQFLLALVLALALWTFVSFSLNPSMQDTFSVPVRLVPASDSLVMVNPNTGLPINPVITATVEVSGPRSEVNQVGAGNFSATADVSGFGLGVHDVPIAVTGPRNVRIRSYTPRQLTISLAQRDQRELAVSVAPSGQLPFLFQSQPPTTSVARVVASGPSELMTRVDTVNAPIELQGRTTSFSEQTRLVAVDKQGKPVPGITLEPSQTTVAVSIEPRVEVQRVGVLPQIIGQPGAGYRSDRIDWNPKYVDVIAQVQITGTLKTEPIDLTGRTEGFTTTVDLIDYGSTITLLTTGPITVTIPIVPFELPYNSSLFVPVTEVNLGANLQATVQPTGLNVTIAGTTQQFSQLAGTTLQAVVDLNGRGPGTYTLVPRVDLPDGLTLVGDLPTVSVTIAPTAVPSATPPEGG